MLLQKIERKKIYHMSLKAQEALHYTQQNSIFNGEQTDLKFLKDVNDFSDKKSSSIAAITLMHDENHIVTDEQCQQIENIALLHKQANIFNNTSMLYQDQIQTKNGCQCGCGRGKGQYFSLCTDEQKMAFLGPGVLLIFFFIKQIKWCLLILLLTYGLYSFISSMILTNFQEDDISCNKFGGLNYFLCMLTQISSFKNKLKNERLTQINLWIGFLISIIWTFGMRYIKMIGIKKDEEIDQLLDSSSDYTIQINYLPVKSYHQKDLLQYLEQLWQTKQQLKNNDNETFSNEQNQKKELKLKNIQLIYNMEGVRKIINQILDLSYQITSTLQPLIDSKKTLLKQPQIKQTPSISDNFQNKKEEKIIENNVSLNTSRSKFSILQSIRNRKINTRKHIISPYSNKIKVQKVEEYINLKQKLIQKYKQLIQFREKFLNDQNFRKELSTTCALIQFQSNQQQKQFLKYFAEDIHKNLIESCLCQNKKLVFKNANIKIRRAAQPSDMNWLNCQKQFSYYRYFFILFMTFIALTISYSSIHFLRTSSTFASSGMYLTVLVIQLFNRIIWNQLQFLVGYEYNNSKTEAIISLMKKSIIAQVINIIVSPLIFNFFVNKNNIYGFKGLSGVVLIFQFMMFFTMFLFNVLNPLYYLKMLLLSIKKTRNIIIRNLCQVIGEIDTIQEIRPVLRQYEGPQFPIAGSYVYITTSIFHALFYCQLQPIIILIVIINILGFLVVLKYLLFRRCKIPELTNVQIFDFALFAVGCGAAFYGAGSLYFLIISKYCLDIDISGSCFVPGVLSIIVWFIFVLNPFNITTKITNLIIKYTKCQKKSSQSKQNQQQEETQSELKKSRKLRQAQDLLAKMFDTNNLQFYKAERKQSYYQFSNVKKLLNFQSELKQVVNHQFQNNNIVEFCQSFCKQKQINQGRQNPNKLKSCIMLQTDEDLPPIIVKRDKLAIKNPSKRIKVQIKSNLRFSKKNIKRRRKIIAKQSQQPLEDLTNQQRIQQQQ